MSCAVEAGGRAVAGIARRWCLGPSRNGRVGGSLCNSFGSLVTGSSAVVRRMQQQQQPQRHQRRGYCFVPLKPGVHAGAHEGEEITVYIKGFLSPGESPDRFDRWLESHGKLTQSHSWGEHAFGFSWQSGKIDPLPVPTALNLAWRLVRKSKLKFSFTPHALAIIAAEEAIYQGGRVWYEFYQAKEKSVEEAPALAEKLKSLHANYDKVRVVAHSLGCRLALEAISNLSSNDRPHELHFCAPAFTENEAKDRLNELAQHSTAVYYTNRDWILSTVFPWFSSSEGPAVGADGLKNSYSGVTAVDVSDHFELFVHREYKNLFHSFALNPNGVLPTDMYPKPTTALEDQKPRKVVVDRRTDDHST